MLGAKREKKCQKFSSKIAVYCMDMFKKCESVASHAQHLSRVVRKPTFFICENKDADQLRGNREADQRLCFRYIDSTIPLLSKSKISRL